MGRLVLLLSVLSVVGWGVVSGQGQGDRGPVNFQPPNGGNTVRASIGPGNVRGPPTAPQQPRCYGGFTVRKALSSTLNSNTRVRFQEVLLNMGGWSQFFGDFQAPCDGVYYFSFHALSQENGDFTLQLIRSSPRGAQYQVTAYGGRSGRGGRQDGRQRTFNQASNSAMIPLRAGDLVYLQLQDGSIYEHPGNEAYTSFTGFLVLQY